MALNPVREHTLVSAKGRGKMSLSRGGSMNGPSHQFPHSSYAEVPAYRTKDGSEIRELMHPDQHGNTLQSLAEARVPPGGQTLLHRHLASAEIYAFTAGRGWMVLGDTRFEVAAGDSIGIPPGTPHCVENSGAEELVILCACAPPYSHLDTELL